jgi:hypothetical protein
VLPGPLWLLQLLLLLGVSIWFNKAPGQAPLAACCLAWCRLLALSICGSLLLLLLLLRLLLLLGLLCCL